MQKYAAEGPPPPHTQLCAKGKAFLHAYLLLSASPIWLIVIYPFTKIGKTLARIQTVHFISFRALSLFGLNVNNFAYFFINAFQ